MKPTEQLDEIERRYKLFSEARTLRRKLEMIPDSGSRVALVWWRAKARELRRWAAYAAVVERGRGDGRGGETQP